MYEPGVTQIPCEGCGKPLTIYELPSHFCVKVTATNPNDQEVADVTAMLINYIAESSNIQKRIIDSMVHEMMYGVDTDAGA